MPATMCSYLICENRFNFFPFIFLGELVVPLVDVVVVVAGVAVEAVAVFEVFVADIFFFLELLSVIYPSKFIVLNFYYYYYCREIISELILYTLYTPENRIEKLN